MAVRWQGALPQALDAGGGCARCECKIAKVWVFTGWPCEEVGAVIGWSVHTHGGGWPGTARSP
eukprot:205666-Chlamydomonas_euryale.AAC.1